MASLRVVISVVSALSVAVVAAITLSITLTSSLAALRTVGTGQSEALLRSAQISSTNLFNIPQTACETMQNVSRGARWPWPANDIGAQDKWALVAETLVTDSQWTLSSIVIYFGDNTLIMSASAYDPGMPFQRPPPYLGSVVVRGTPVNVTGGAGSTANQSSLPTRNRLQRTSDRSDVDASDPLFAQVMPILHFTDFVNDPLFWDTALVGATQNARLSVSTGAIAVNIGGITQGYFGFVAPLHRQGDRPRFDAPYAFASAAVATSDLNAFLRETRATPHTLAIAMDWYGYLLGTSSDVSFETTFPVEPGMRPQHVGCVLTRATGLVTVDVSNFELCRVNAADYGHAGLAAVMRDRELAYSIDNRVVRVDASDGVYFAGVARVPLRFLGPSVHLVLLIPEVDIIGDVVRSRNVAIGVTCAVFVIVAALTFVAITLLLSPLHTIAERMQRAADFDDDGADETVSAMAEVAALQRAYYEMNDELNRIRSFVPQSVLVEKKRQRAYAMGEVDVDDDDEDYPVGSSLTTVELTGSVRSTRSSRRSKSDAAGGEKPAQSAVAAGIASEVLAGTVLVTKSVAVLVANASDFTTFAGGPPSSSTAKRAADTLGALVQAAELAIGVNGGVLGNFHGDHFTATFNAVRPCAAPNRRACAAALALLDCDPMAAVESRIGADVTPATSSATHDLRFHMGIASGRCLIGNTGTATAKTFSVVGPAFTQAIFLERLSKLYGPECRALVTDRVCGDIVTQYRFRYVDHVLLPPRQPTLIATLLGLVPPTAPASATGNGGGGERRDNEWLYVLEAQESSDPNTSHNAAFRQLHGGRLAECVSFLDGVDSTASAPESSGPAADAAAIGTANLRKLISDWQSNGVVSSSSPGPTAQLPRLHEAFLRPS